MHYSHTVVRATLVRAGSHRVLPTDVEAGHNSDGKMKQDGEINAGKRLIERFRLKHRQMKARLMEMTCRPTSRLGNS